MEAATEEPLLEGVEETEEGVEVEAEEGMEDAGAGLLPCSGFCFCLALLLLGISCERGGEGGQNSVKRWQEQQQQSGGVDYPIIHRALAERMPD